MKIVIDLSCVIAIVGAGSIEQRGFQIRLNISDLTRIVLQALENIFDMSRMNLEHTAFYHFGGDFGFSDCLRIALTAYTFKHYLHDFISRSLFRYELRVSYSIFSKTMLRYASISSIPSGRLIDKIL